MLSEQSTRMATKNVLKNNGSIVLAFSFALRCLATLINPLKVDLYRCIHYHIVI